MIWVIHRLWHTLAQIFAAAGNVFGLRMTRRSVAKEVFWPSAVRRLPLAFSI